MLGLSILSPELNGVLRGGKGDPSVPVHTIRTIRRSITSRSISRLTSKFTLRSGVQYMALAVPQMIGLPAGGGAVTVWGQHVRG